MNWLRRFGVAILIPVVILGYFGVRHYRRSQWQEDVERIAQATAEIWVATATLRDSADVFAAYRDSVLADHRLTDSDIEAFTSRFDGHPEDYTAYLSRVNDLVDSLAAERGRVDYDSAHFPGNLFEQ
ncbi:MAG: hypothetical protein ABIE70_09525 [bacterium]